MIRHHSNARYNETLKLTRGMARASHSLPGAPEGFLHSRKAFHGPPEGDDESTSDIENRTRDDDMVRRRIIMIIGTIMNRAAGQRGDDSQQRVALEHDAHVA